MTLQDEIVHAFVQEGYMRKIVKRLTKEDMSDYDLEEPSGEGWADVVAKTPKHQVLFEVKTHVKELPDGKETHDENLAGTIRQLKKYRRNNPSHYLVAIIPRQDASKWAQHYANAGFLVIGWAGNRILKCPICGTETGGNLVAPHFCPACGGKPIFSHIRLEKTSFVLLESYVPKERVIETRKKEEDPTKKMLAIIREDMDIMEQALKEFRVDKFPFLPIDSYKSALASGLLTSQLEPLEFRAIRNLFLLCASYNKEYEKALQSSSIGSHQETLLALQKYVKVILEQIGVVRETMNWRKT
jgi:rubrerythrin